MPPRWSRGSRWLRWDPHLHVPGTLLNDQFPDDWSAFFGAVASANPAAVALGIADYFSLAGYKAFRDHRGSAELPSVELVFPNIECGSRPNSDRARVSTCTCSYPQTIQGTSSASRIDSDSSRSDTTVFPITSPTAASETSAEHIAWILHYGTTPHGAQAQASSRSTSATSRNSSTLIDGSARTS